MAMCHLPTRPIRSSSARDLRRARRWLALWVLRGLSLWPLAAVAAGTPLDVGEAIYRHGLTSDGTSVQASRDGEARLQGDAAACINCHKRSGLGTREGRGVVPPVAGRHLFRSRDRGSGDFDVPFVESMRGGRPPYTDATLARAIREGLDSEGRPLRYLMPHYRLDDAQMAALIAYLKGLDRRNVPGVTDSTLHFATIITPDADPVKRQGMLDVLERYFADRNARQMVPPPHVSGTRGIEFMAHRRWELHVWELSGPESTWREQLDRRLREQPVFAIVSGLGGARWRPVHDFCEQQQVPCLFPNVELPVHDEGDFYSLYLSNGVLLEADLIAAALAAPDSGATIRTVRQVYRVGDVGAAAARALAAALKRHGIEVSNRALAADAPAAQVAAAAHAKGADALVLWLRAPDVAALGDATGDVPPAVYLSALMGGLERTPLPRAWRERTRLAYPFDLPQRRRVRVDFALGWFSIRRIPVVAEQVQADTFLACGLVSEVVNHMSDTFVRDYLIERFEDMLSHRILTGYYPRLSLAPGQRFASKGGFLVRLTDDPKTRLAADRDWLVP